MADEAMFSRSGSSHPLGKMTDEFRIDCHSQVRDLLRGMAAEVGMTEAEYERHILYAHAFGGPDAYKSAMASRLDAMFGNTRREGAVGRTE